jgi:hypothetical protein
MFSSLTARLLGRLVVDHHDVVYLIRHHHFPVTDAADVLVVFVLDALSRLSHTFVSVGFPRHDHGAVDEVNEHLVTLDQLADAEYLVVCWCTGNMVTAVDAATQLDLLRALQVGAMFSGLELRDVYWVHPRGFVSLADASSAAPSG